MAHLVVTTAGGDEIKCATINIGSESGELTCSNTEKIATIEAEAVKKIEIGGVVLNASRAQGSGAKSG